MAHKASEAAAIQILKEGGWSQELIEAKSSEPVEITSSMEDALNEVWKRTAVRAEDLDLCRGAYFVDRSDDPLKPSFTAINNIDGYGFKEYFDTYEDAMRFLRDGQLGGDDPEHPLCGLDRADGYLRLSRDVKGKIDGYELVFWDGDANRGLGSFCLSYGDPAAEIAALHDAGHKIMPMQHDRSEYWVDFGTPDFYEWVDTLKNAFTSNDPEKLCDPCCFDYIGKHPGDFLFEQYVEQLEADVLSERYNYGYALLDESHIVRAGDAYSPVFEKELDSSGLIWFTTDEQAVACFKNAEGGLSWLSDNVHAEDALKAEYENIMNGKVTPDFISDKGERNMRIYAELVGSLGRGIAEAKAASADMREQQGKDERDQQHTQGKER